jgi:hypothetical protein
MRWVGLSAADVRTVEALFDQQMWCWGCDVRRGEGNLLLEYGGDRLPAPEPRLRSAYCFTLCPSCRLTLWGWGMWIASEPIGSLFIRRARFAASWCAVAHLAPGAWCERDLAPLLANAQPAGECALRLLQSAVTWIADYEAWIAAQVGSAYRISIVDAYPQRRHCKDIIPADGIAEAWRRLDNRLRISAFNQADGQG